MISLHFPWRADFEIGDARIDTQHHRLIDLANLLLEASHREQKEEVVDRALANLKTYALEHFADEESYFRDIESPLLADHMIQHDALIRDIEAFHLTRDEAPLALGETVATWVRDRLVPHMLVDDRNTLNAR